MKTGEQKSENVWTAFCNLPPLLLVFEAKCQQMRSDLLNSILIPVQCDPIQPPRACLLTLLVAHITGTFYQTKLSVHSLWLLFQVDVYILLYVNDIYRCSEQLSFILFADDIHFINIKTSMC